MRVSSPSRNTSARKPSHFGANSQPSPSGRASRGLASIGSIGGSNGSFTPSRYPLGAEAGLPVLDLACNQHRRELGSSRARTSRRYHRAVDDTMESQAGYDDIAHGYARH